jgi:glutamine synthetase
LKSVVEGGELAGYEAKSETLDFGTNSVFSMEKNCEDRNRTAPFPFCGNRFEFRAVGSSQNIAWPLALVNTAVADSLKVMADALESGKSIKEVVQETLSKHMRVIFNGNGYSSEWPIEAKKRGLWELPQTIDALKVFNSEKNQTLFESAKIFTKHELECRTEIEYENYTKAIQIEADCLLNMINQAVLPGCATDLKNLENSSSKTVKQLFEEKDELYFQLYTENKKLKQTIDSFPSNGSGKEQAEYAATELKSKLNSVRAIADKIEKVLPSSLYPFPNYETILYDHHSN